MSYGEPSCQEEYDAIMEAEAIHEAELDALAAQYEAEPTEGEELEK